MRADLLAAACAKATKPSSDPYGLSPVVSSYQSWMGGRATPNSLPRPPHVFDTQSFGPLSPMHSNTIDEPEEGTERPRPRRFQYPIGFNMPSYPGVNKLVSFANLRMYGDLYSVSRACIQLRKQELVGLGWDIVPSSPAHEQIRGDAAALQDFKERRDLAVKFWQRPDPNFNNFANWFYTLLDDMLVIDAMSLYLHPTRVAGKGPFGSNLAALEVIDGSTIFPLVDIAGGTPLPPAPAYQQYIYGVPRVELMSPLVGNDEDREKELGAPEAEFRGDQLLYLPLNTRSWTNYGYGPVEQAIMPIITGLKRQQWRNLYFSEGTLPPLWLMAPPDFTASQIQQLQDSQNLMAGDIAAKWRIRALPGGCEIKEMKDAKIGDRDVDQILWEEVMMVFDVKPQELGLQPGGKSGGLGGKGAVEGMERASQRQSLLPLVRWLEDSLFNYVIQNIWGQTDMRFKFTGIEVKDDQLDKAQMLDVFVRNGTMTIDEVRAEIDLEPYGFPETSRPNVYLPTGVVPVELVSAVAVAEASSEALSPADIAGEEYEEPDRGSKPNPKDTPPPLGSSAAPPATMPRPAATITHEGPPPTGRRNSGSAKAAQEELKALRNWLRHRSD